MQFQLSILYGMHIYWFILIVGMFSKSIRQGFVRKELISTNDYDFKSTYNNGANSANSAANKDSKENLDSKNEKPTETKKLNNAPTSSETNNLIDKS